MHSVRATIYVIVLSLLLTAPLASQTPQEKSPPEPAAPAASQIAQPQEQTAPPAPAAAPIIPPKEHSVLGELEIVTFNSKIFRNIRNLRVWLPGTILRR